ncbi:MAG TPA: choice-of-anchor tandem repeat GloVer-containing protein, partial [Flavitalea sp.]|nr:choice-of-anchor tandem repeat GloVer-containing protein [Flavitalea sp.]
MKYFYTLVLCASMFSGIAQPTFHGVRNLWNGEFVSYNNANNETKLLYAIDNDGYGAGFAQLLHASDSKLYGTAASGGSFNGGVLFSVDPASGQFTRLANFTRPNLFNPSSSLVEVADGRLFGTAYFNDATDVNGGGGVIYSYNRQTKELTIEARVSDENGGYIQQGLAYDKKNTLYGATFGPGSDQPGVLFSFDIKQKSLTIIHRFSIENHTATSSGLVFGPDGKLYGVNAEGGTNHAGELYAFNPILSTLEVVHTFGDPYETGGYETSPNGTPTLATDGKLYGILKTYADGEGFIYSYEPSTHTYDIAFHFDPDFIPQYAIIFGGSAAVGLVSEAGNQLFGYSLNNGLYAFNIETKQVTTWNKNQAIPTTDESSTLAFTGPDGVIKINTTTEEWAVRKRLFAETGSYLTTNLLFDQNGVLYGRTQSGGNGNKGVLFAFDPKNGSYNVLMDSTLGQRGNMIMGFDQNIYFSTRTFGPTPFTTIDRISLQDRTQSTIHYFGVYPGALPGPSEYIMQASDSLIYWLKPFGGASSPAGIYSYSIPTDRIGKLATIPQGYSLIPWLTEGTDKTLYGFGSSLADASKRLIFSF